MTYSHALGLGAALISMVAIAACGATQPGPRGSTAPVPSPALTTPGLTASSPVPSSGSDAGTPVCRTPRLRITLARSAAAGPIVGGYIGFINESGTACHLTGWPALVALTAAGTSATASHVRTTGFGPNITAVPVVVLEPGTLAEAAFAGNEVSGPCAGSSFPPPYRRLRVTPPGGTGNVVISAWLPDLGTYLPACGGIEVSPVVPSSGSRVARA